MRWRKAVYACARRCGAMPALALDRKAAQLVALDAVVAELKTHDGIVRFKKESFGLRYDALHTTHRRAWRRK